MLVEKVESEMQWVICPVCHQKTRLKLRRDTVISNFMLFCPKCKQERLINVRDFRVEIAE
ncbi:MAG: cysteine-rich KTR domain-containing protein [Lachnospiraceae bacterium]|nr:cysteine-rich KTR domain-containing protein [Lachnospiraceae bacterium]